MQKAKVTAADIARLAGVGRAAVSNWRKRYDSFPAPVAGTTSSPEFDFGEVELWLVEHGKLPAVADEDRLWRNLLAAAATPAEALAAVGEHLLGRRPLPYQPLEKDLAGLVDRHGGRGAFAELWRRFDDLPGQRAVTTPDGLADLMVTLAQAGGRSVLDPACGTGRLLRAATQAGAAAVYGQDNDPVAAHLAELWLALNAARGEVRTGDSLRHDAFPEVGVDAVVANLPFGQTNWGHEELGYDRRWEFGVPPRTEPELAWVQHAVAHLKADGLAVLLMPPSAAGRRAGRRIRAELLRRGLIRAIVALPPGAATPHAIPLHLWILQRTSTPAPTALFVNVAAHPLDRAYRRSVEVVGRFLNDEETAEPSIAYAVPMIELLDEEVDLTPGRHGLATSADTDASASLRDSRERLETIVGALPTLLPDVSAAPDPDGPRPTVSISDLVRSGQVQLLGPVRSGSADTGRLANRAILTADDVALGRPASGRADIHLAPRIELQAGDVVVPTAAGLVTRVVTDGGALLGRGLHLLRCDPQVLDPWFLAGHLRTSANERQASSLSGTMRFDVRRAQVPRIPADEQRRHGTVFRRLQRFDEAIHHASALSGDLSRLTADGLANGSIRPGDDD